MAAIGTIMNGHWTCEVAEERGVGRIVIELDSLAGRIKGRGYLFPPIERHPSMLSLLDLDPNKNPQTLQLRFMPLNDDGHPFNNDELFKLRFPNVSFPEEVTVTFNFSEEALSLTWQNPNETHQVYCPRARTPFPSLLPKLAITRWQDYKNYVLSLPHYKYAFRGQKRPWRLRTPFHRTGRADLFRFFDTDIHSLYRSLSGSISAQFNLTDPTHHAAFSSLIQHHGYPTPLLDWSYSPYVAAYFAFKDTLDDTTTDSVRIIILDKEAWSSELPRVPLVNLHWPHLTIVEPIALNNPRLIPQQAFSSYTTVDDIEAYVMDKEKGHKTQGAAPFMQAIDLSASEGPLVMRELTQMGITAASLFPGIDGICEDLRLRNFILSNLNH